MDGEPAQGGGDHRLLHRPRTRFDNRLTKLKLTFDGDAGDESVTLDLKPENTLQDFPLQPHRCKSVTLEPLEWTEVGKRPLIGIDNIWIRVAPRRTTGRRVTPLLNVGALVKYQMGEGGVILNHVKVQEPESNPVNAQKKQNIVATLLRNLGATFAGERVLVAGSGLKYRPIPLDEKCTQFLTKEKGWYDGGDDLSAFPVGENTLSGVRYEMRDFKTSPLPALHYAFRERREGADAGGGDRYPGRRARRTCCSSCTPSARTRSGSRPTRTRIRRRCSSM